MKRGELPKELLDVIKFDFKTEENWLIKDWRDGKFKYDHLKFLSYLNQKAFNFENEELKLDLYFNFLT